jgi:hypothetical protein
MNGSGIGGGNDGDGHDGNDDDSARESHGDGPKDRTP